MTRIRRVLPAIMLVILGAVSACDARQIEWFTNEATPAQQASVVAALKAKHRPAASSGGDCYSAIDRYWHGDKAWARKIAWRESNNTPTVRNRSGASGCMQMMMPTHAQRFRAVGCSPSQWASADCNIKAAWNLYQAAGRSPWAM